MTFVVAASPGTGIDILAREIGQQFTTHQGKAVVVDNRAGASGNLAAEFAAHAKPDGQTLLLAATTFATNAALNNAHYDPQRDFLPVALLGTGTLCLVVNSALSPKSLQEFIAAAKVAPGSIAYASPGNGTPQHLAMELVKLETGIDLLHVPFKATSSALNDVAGGHVAAMIAPVHTVLPLVAAGKLRILAVMSSKRMARLPDVPTFAESGLPKVQIDVWYAMFAPAGTSPAVVARLNADVNSALQAPGVVANASRQGVEVAGGSPQVLARRLAAELERWPPVIKAAHITAD